MEGQRSIGGYDDGFQGVSLSSGFGLNSDEQLTAAHFGHAILDLWGVSHPSGGIVHPIWMIFRPIGEFQKGTWFLENALNYLVSNVRGADMSESNTPIAQCIQSDPQ